MMIVVTGTGGAWERSGFRRASRRHLLARTLAAGVAMRELLPKLFPGRDAIIAPAGIADEPMWELPKREYTSWMTGWPSGLADGVVLQAGSTSLTMRGEEATVKVTEFTRQAGTTKSRLRMEEVVVPHWLQPRVPRAQFEGEGARLGRAAGAPGARGMPRASVRAVQLEGP